MLVKVAFVASLVVVALVGAVPASSDNPRDGSTAVMVDTSKCPGLASSQAINALGTLTVVQRNPGSPVFDLSTTFRGSASDGTDAAAYTVNYSGSIKGAPSAEVLGVGTLVFMGHGHGMVVHDVALIAFGPISFDVADAGSVQCIG